MFLRCRGIKKDVNGFVECWDLIFNGNDFFNTMHKVKGHEPYCSLGSGLIGPQG